ncbi:MAG: MaoC family dehydratase [Solirubrobacteraceae bacterium]
MTDQKYFEDFVVGERWESPSRTLNDAHFLAFSALTGDTHPVHNDDVYAAAHPFGKRVAHGLLMASITALGGSDLAPQVHEAILAFVEQRTTFRKPGLIGDTVRPVFEVVACEPKRGEKGIVRIRVAVLGSDGEELLEGEHAYLIKGRNWSAPA